MLKIVRDCDQEVRSALLSDGLWFSPVSQETGEIIPMNEAGIHRHSRARMDLKDWLARVCLPYHSPHKFRHGHAVYAVIKAKDVPALKAVSQNLMPSNLSITDGAYGVMSENVVRGQITALGKKIIAEEIKEPNQLIPLLEQLLTMITKEN